MRAMTIRGKRLLALVALACLGSLAVSTPIPASESKARAVKVTVLSTMLADTQGIGEWGFAAVVEVDGYRLLFDTGAREETVLRNAEELKVDLTDVTDVVLSHNHADHTGGLLALRRALGSRNPRALSRAHVAPGIFLPRRYEARGDAEGNPMRAVREAYETTGGKVFEHPKAESSRPGYGSRGRSRVAIPSAIFRRARESSLRTAWWRTPFPKTCPSSWTGETR